MTLNELKTKIDEMLGMESRLQTRGLDARLIYFSPTGILLFSANLSSHATNEAWQFAGTTTALPESWEDLCSLHRARESK